MIYCVVERADRLFFLFPNRGCRLVSIRSCSTVQFFERTSFHRATTHLKHIKNVLVEEVRQVVISDIWS